MGSGVFEIEQVKLVPVDVPGLALPAKAAIFVVSGTGWGNEWQILLPRTDDHYRLKEPNWQINQGICYRNS